MFLCKEGGQVLGQHPQRLQMVLAEELEGPLAISCSVRAGLALSKGMDQMTPEVSSYLNHCNFFPFYGFNEDT